MSPTVPVVGPRAYIEGYPSLVEVEFDERLHLLNILQRVIRVSKN